MSKKMFLILLAAALAQTALIGFQSCCSRRSSNMCPFLTAMSVTALDNADSTVHALTGPVIARAMVLQIQLADSVAACACIRPKQYGLIPAAYAMCKTYESFGAIDTFIITSNREFDTAHPAGSNLRDLFFIQHEADLLNGGDFNCYLRNTPADTATHIFSVHLVVHYRDYYRQRVFDASTQPVKLLQ